MQVSNPSDFEVAKNTELRKLSRVRGRLQQWQRLSRRRLSRLTFQQLHDLRIHAQEVRSQFAHLLNRGSSLE